MGKHPYPVDFEGIFECLNATGVRYVCVGGIAVVLHGVDRLTADLDLVIELTPESSRKAIEALLTAGFHAKIPADPRGFADAETRRAWIRDKHMQVRAELLGHHPQPAGCGHLRRISTGL